MYICNTKANDVRDALKNMVARNMIDHLDGIDEDKPQLMQVGIRKYKTLKKAVHDAVRKEIEKKKVTHLLNFRTMTLHKKDCSHAGENVLRAYIATPGATGLWPCGHCKPWVAPLTW